MDINIHLHPQFEYLEAKLIEDDFEPIFSQDSQQSVTFNSSKDIQIKSALSQEKELLKKFSSEIDESLDKLRFFIEDKQQEVAFEFSLSLQHRLKENSTHPIYKDFCKLIMKENKNFFNEIEDDYQTVIDVKEWFSKEDNWITEVNKKGMLVRYQHLTNSSMIIIRIDTEVKIPLTNFLGLIYETDLFPEWFPFCNDVKTLAQPDKATKIVRAHISLPVISDRELYVKGWGLNNIEKDGKLYVMCHSIDDDKQQCMKYNVQCPENPKIVRAHMSFFSWEIEPITMDDLKITVLSSFDMKLKNVPSSFINFVTRKFASSLFERLVSNSKKYKGSKWEQNQKHSPDFYNWMHQRTQEHFDRIKNKQFNTQISTKK